MQRFAFLQTSSSDLYLIFYTTKIQSFSLFSSTSFTNILNLFVENMLWVTHNSRSLPHLIFIDFQAYSTVPVKDEASCKVGSDHGEEEMEVDSTDEQEQDARNQGGKTQIGKSKSAATFNTLSSLSSLRPGILS